MSIDISLLNYKVCLVTENGVQYDLDNALTSLSWEEQEGQLAQKALLSFADTSENGESVRSILKLNRMICIFCDWGEGLKKLFEGFIWEWQYRYGQQKNLSVTAYDPMIRFQQSKDFKYFSAGMDTKAIIDAVCGDAGAPVEYKWANSITHEKKVFRACTAADMIFELLDEVRYQTDCPYTALYRDGKLEINACGTNTDMYVFKGEEIVEISDKVGLKNLVTRVKILGKADDDGRSSVEAVVDGDLEFGVLQEILFKDESFAAAEAEARAVLKERGQPDESIMVTAPDLPFLRKGDAVEIIAGNLNGVFRVLGISHNALTRQMTMTLERRKSEPQKSSGNSAGNTIGGDFVVGDEVVLNGCVYIDSYGNGKGRAFTNYKSTVTIVVPKDRPCPYHIGKVGWVYPNEITKV